MRAMRRHARAFLGATCARSHALFALGYHVLVSERIMTEALCMFGTLPRSVGDARLERRALTLALQLPCVLRACGAGELRPEARARRVAGRHRALPSRRLHGALGCRCLHPEVARIVDLASFNVCGRSTKKSNPLGRLTKVSEAAPVQEEMHTFTQASCNDSLQASRCLPQSWIDLNTCAANTRLNCENSTARWLLTRVGCRALEQAASASLTAMLTKFVPSVSGTRAGDKGGENLIKAGFVSTPLSVLCVMSSAEIATDGLTASKAPSAVAWVVHAAEVKGEPGSVQPQLSLQSSVAACPRVAVLQVQALASAPEIYTVPSVF